jgi:TonB family protein
MRRVLVGNCSPAAMDSLNESPRASVESGGGTVAMRSWGIILLSLLTIGPVRADDPPVADPGSTDGSTVPAPEPQGSPFGDVRPPRTLKGGTAARFLRWDKPGYPVSARRRAQEGWVQLSFVIGADGRVVDPVVQDSSGIADFERAALKAAASMRYSPATVDGKPVEQCAGGLRIRFRLDGLPLGATPGFASRFRDAEAALSAGDAAKAAAVAGEIEAQGVSNNYESTRLLVLQAQVRESVNDNAGALALLERMMCSGLESLEPDARENLLRSTFWSSVKLQRWPAALRAAELMTPAVREQPDVSRALAEVRAAVDGPLTLVFPGEVGYRSGSKEGPANWQHELMRREFAFDRIEGAVDDFEVRCDWRRLRAKVNTSDAWRIPDAWGACTVLVFGEPGAKLRLVEYPLAAAVAPVTPASTARTGP